MMTYSWMKESAFFCTCNIKQQHGNKGSENTVNNTVSFQSVLIRKKNLSDSGEIRLRWQVSFERLGQFPLHSKNYPLFQSLIPLFVSHYSCISPGLPTTIPPACDKYDQKIGEWQTLMFVPLQHTRGLDVIAMIKTRRTNSGKRLTLPQPHIEHLSLHVMNSHC